MFYLYKKYRCLVEKEEEDVKVAKHLMDFREDSDSEAGQPEEEETDTGSAKVEPEAEPPRELTPARSHSKLRS